VDLTTLADQAARLHAAGMASSDNGQPTVAARKLRAGLRLIERHGAGDEPVIAQIRGRLLISLAWAESERGRVELGFRLLDQAEPSISDGQRPILLAQRALLLSRNGRIDLALRQYDQAVALLSEQASPPDLVKALNNRSLIHLDACHVGLAWLCR
jgi:tetratricopeptide (TPR) repeat protein